MKMKILFYGFQHSHIDVLYKLAQQNQELEIIGCLEEDAEARQTASDRLGICFDERDYDEWLKKDIDIVAVGVKYGQRGRAAVKALEAGKHIISDKPLCTSMEELEKIERIVKRNDVKIACMLELRYMPSACRARALLKEKMLGEIRNLSFTGQHCIDYAHRPSWYFEEGMHGGTVNDLAIHGIDLVRDITGLEVERLDGIRTWNAYAVKNPEFKDCAVFMARLTNGAELLADVSYSAPSQVFSMPTYWNFKIWCERGLMAFNLIDSHVTVFEEGTDEPQIYEGIDPRTDFLRDLTDEIKRGSNTVTNSVLSSTRTVLGMQEEADKLW